MILRWSWLKRPPQHEIPLTVQLLNEIGHKLDAVFRLSVQLSRKVDQMAVDFTNFNAALVSVKDEIGVIASDVQKVIDKLSAPDADAQSKVDAATAALQGIKSQADGIAAAAEKAVGGFQPSANGG